MEYADIVAWLKTVQAHNSREWYMQNKEMFREIHGALNNLYFAVGNELRKKADIDINPRKSISRPYNDQRFGNKPYLRDNLWVTFQSEKCPKPAFFIEFSSYGIRIGMGYYAATPEQMRRMRMKIDDNPQKFLKIVEKVLENRDIHRMGDTYKRKLSSNYEGLLEEIYNLRNIYFQKIILPEEWSELEQTSGEIFAELVPVYDLLRK